MHGRIVVIVWTCLALMSCGSSSGFEQAAPREPKSGEPPQVTDTLVENAFSLHAQLPRPYRIGVVFRDPKGPIEYAPWRWEPEHRAQLMNSLETLEGSDELSAVFSIARSTIAADNLHAIRVAAARHGADAVLVVSGADEARRKFNAWAATYIAVLPVLFAPAADLQVRFTAHAELWDVRNEYLYVAAEGEARAEQRRALPFIDRKEAVARGQREALDYLRKELRKRLTRLHPSTAG